MSLGVPRMNEDNIHTHSCQADALLLEQWRGSVKKGSRQRALRRMVDERVLRLIFRDCFCAWKEVIDQRTGAASAGLRGRRMVLRCAAFQSWIEWIGDERTRHAKANVASIFVTGSVARQLLASVCRWRLAARWTARLKRKSVAIGMRSKRAVLDWAFGTWLHEGVKEPKRIEMSTRVVMRRWKSRFVAPA